MRTEHRELLVSLLAHQDHIAATEAPPAYLGWEAAEHTASVTYGPRYEPSKWFGPMPDYRRQRLMRGLYHLERDGLVDIAKSEGGRLERVKLTPAGEAKARELASIHTVSEQEAPADAS